MFRPAPLRTRLVTLASAAVLTCAGCSTTGVKVDQDALLAFRPGVATCAQVVERFGTPTTSLMFPDGRRQLHYTYSHTQARATSFIPYASLFAGGSDTEYTQAMIECDAEGRVLQSSSTQGQTGTGTGFIGGARQP